MVGGDGFAQDLRFDYTPAFGGPEEDVVDLAFGIFDWDGFVIGAGCRAGPLLHEGADDEVFGRSVQIAGEDGGEADGQVGQGSAGHAVFFTFVVEVGGEESDVE